MSEVQATEKQRKPYFPLNGPEVVQLTVNTVLDRLRPLLVEKLREDTRLNSEVHAFPHAELFFQFNFNLLMEPKAEGRKIAVSSAIHIPNIEPIPPDAVRVLNDLPVLVEERPKSELSPGKVDVAKMANEIDPKLKQLTEAKFGAGEPFRQPQEPPQEQPLAQPVADNPHVSPIEGVIDLEAVEEPKLGKVNKNQVEVPKKA